MAGSASANATVLTLAPAAHSATAGKSAPQPAITSRPAPFNWRQVESPDYKEYVANLRAIGCPEKTIKEIIIADVNDLFSARRAAITQTNRFEYWRASAGQPTAEQHKRLQELFPQKAELLKDLGIEVTDFSDLIVDSYRDSLESKDLELDFLSEPKRQSLKDLMLRMVQQQIAAEEGSGAAQDLEQQTQAAIKALLTPEEFRDYELRTSVPAVQLRSVLKEMDPTEQEFNTIYDSWNAMNAHPPDSAEYREAQQSSEAALQTLLGPTRFDLYLKGVKLLGYSQ